MRQGPAFQRPPTQSGVYPTMQLLRRWLIPWHYHQIDLQLCTFGGKYHCVASVRMLLGLNIAISACSAACQVYKVSQQTNWSYLPMCISTPGSFRVRDVHMVNIMQTKPTPLENEGNWHTQVHKDKFMTLLRNFCSVKRIDHILPLQ